MPDQEGKQLAQNRKAFFDYEILERLEAGIVLTGTEIKSVRAGRIDLRGAYARPNNGELWLYDAHISPYEQAAEMFNHDPTRPRKLLMHREQIDELVGKSAQKGYTLVPLRIYVKRHVAKLELGVARGKRQYDKRRTIIERDVEREAQRDLRAYAKGE